MSPRNTQFWARRVRKPGGCSTGPAADAAITASLITHARRGVMAVPMDVVRHLGQLLRIDTTNPPGRETPAAEYLADLFVKAGLEPVLVGAEPERKNVVVRLKGTGEKAPLLLAAHLDVVPAEAGSWTHPPFAG